MSVLHLTIFLFLFGGGQFQASHWLQAQPTITASLDAYEGLIGDQFKLSITAEHQTGTQLDMPNLTELAVDSLEILNISDVITETVDNIVKTRQIYTLTGFEVGEYTIRKVGVRYSGSGQTGIIQTEPLTLTLVEPEIDPESGPKPNKANLEVPLTLAEMLPYIVLGILLFAIIAYLIRYFLKKRQEEDTIVVPPPPPRPAHETALEALEQLTKAQYWQQGKVKQYYSELTDIARRYIEERYDIPALESTTDELMQSFKEVTVSTEALHPLQTVLGRADLVKFAKAKPSIAQHGDSFKVVEQFILQTKLVKPLFEAETVSS